MVFLGLRPVLIDEGDLLSFEVTDALLSGCIASMAGALALCTFTAGNGNPSRCNCHQSNELEAKGAIGHLVP